MVDTLTQLGRASLSRKLTQCDQARRRTWFCQTAVVRMPAVIVLMLALTACGAATPAAEPTPSPSATPAPSASSVLVQGKAPAPTLGAAELSDLTTLAEQQGTPVEETIERHRGANQFSALVSDLQADPDSGYAAAGHADDGSTWIRFTRKPDDEVLRRIETELAVPVQVRWGAPANEKSLTKVSQAVQVAVARYPGVGQTASEVRSEPQGDVIRVYYRPEPGTKVDKAGLRRRALAATGGVPVKVVIVVSSKVRAVAE